MDNSTEQEPDGDGTRVERPPDSTEPERAGLNGPVAWPLCVALLSLMAVQMLTVLPRKSITVDEAVMIPAAYYHLAEGDFQLVHEHPPLSKILAAAPLLLFKNIKAVRPVDGNEPNAAVDRITRPFTFWGDNVPLFGRISYWARVPLIALTVATGLLLFLFARSLFGDVAALVALSLYALEPTVLAHGRVVQTDMPAAFGLLLVVFALKSYLKSPTTRRALAVGAAGGVAVLAKFSMLAVGPVYAVVFGLLLWRAPRAGRRRSAVLVEGALAALILFAIIWAAYAFQSRALTATDLSWIADKFPASVETTTAAVRTLSYIFPTDFVLGIIFQLKHAEEGHRAGLLGMYSLKGWWYYFPVAFALKTPLPTLLLSVVALLWGAFRLVCKGERRFLFLLVPFGLYTLYVAASPINIGVRYYLPAYPFLMIGAGALAAHLFASRPARLRRRIGTVSATLLIAWAGVEAVRAYPDHMSYMNQSASSRPHWWYLSDSNVEWGDDARAVAVYLRRQGERRARCAFMMSWMTPHLYGVECVDVLASDESRRPPTRYTAIGASFLNGSTIPPFEIDGRPSSEQERVNRFAAYRDRTPERVFGNSIYLFREDR